MAERERRQRRDAEPAHETAPDIERISLQIDAKERELRSSTTGNVDRARAELTELYEERRRVAERTVAKLDASTKKEPDVDRWENFKKNLEKGWKFVKEASLYTGAAAGYGTFIWLRDSVRATFTAAWEIGKGLVTGHESAELTKGWEPPKEHEASGKGAAAGAGSTASHKQEAHGDAHGKKGHGGGHEKGHGEHDGGHGEGHGEGHKEEHGGGHEGGHEAEHKEGHAEEHEKHEEEHAQQEEEEHGTKK